MQIEKNTTQNLQKQNKDKESSFKNERTKIIQISLKKKCSLIETYPQPNFIAIFIE